MCRAGDGPSVGYAPAQSHRPLEHPGLTLQTGRFQPGLGPSSIGAR
jgi:hypothetical protein